VVITPSEAHVWFVFGGSGPIARPTDTPSVPDHLDWDCFLGPAPFRPYHPRYVAGWGAWREYGAGCLGGGGSHSINMAFKGLKLDGLWQGEGEGPIRIESEIPEACPENFPRWQICRYDIPARGSLPPARIHWYNGPEQELKRQGIWDRLEKIAGRSLEWKDGSWTPRSGTLLVGTKGVVHTNAPLRMRLVARGGFPERRRSAPLAAERPGPPTGMGSGLQRWAGAAFQLQSFRAGHGTDAAGQRRLAG